MSSPTNAPLTGPIQTITAGHRPRSLAALGAAIAGSILTVVGFYAWIIAALNGTGEGTGLGQVLFFVGLTLGAVAIGLAIFTIVKGAPRLLPVATIAVALAPAVFLLGLSIR